MNNNIPTVLKQYFTEEEINNLVNMKYTLVKCNILVNRVFENTKDNIVHLYRVSDQQTDIISKSAALLHDIVEYIDIPALRFLKIDEEVISIVELLTNSSDLTYEQEISKIIKSGNYKAISIKYADIIDNTTMDKNPSQLIRLRRFFKMDD